MSLSSDKSKLIAINFTSSSMLNDKGHSLLDFTYLMVQKAGLGLG